MPLAQDVGGARGRDLLVSNNKRCNCSINISNWILKQDTWMYMVTNVMYYSIAISISLIQSLIHLSRNASWHLSLESSFEYLAV